MRKISASAICLTLCVFALLLSACATPVTPEETKDETLYYAEKYADESAPSETVQEVLDFLEGCVGGQYIYGAQGTPITRDYVMQQYEIYQDYFSHGRLEYFLTIAESNEQSSHTYPSDYAWDCSGLWWDCANNLQLYDEYTDMTADATYHECCIPITKDELRPGDIVFLEDEEEDKIVHMGIVGRRGYIYEAVGGFSGVVKQRTIDKRVYYDIVRGGILVNNDWNVFGRPKIFED